MNRRGQFSIIAALLVAVVLITTVIVTYSTIRNSPVQQQPQIQSAIDEINMAAKQILGFTVGYYGSVLKSTGNSTYARQLATNYLQSGLSYVASMHPEWGASFDATDSQLYVNWYGRTSNSNGNLSLSYNLTGLGISGIKYETSCSLTVQVMSSVNYQACLMITKDGNEPLINLGKRNFKFYRYETTSSTWTLVNPPSEPLAYSNGTYETEIPPGIDIGSYLVQVEDQRGILVVASSYSFYTCDLVWNATSAVSPEADHYVDSYNSTVDGSPDIGIHSNFTAMQHGPDYVNDTLTEAVTQNATPEAWISPISYEGSGWTNPTNAYDNNTSTFASATIPQQTWSSNLTLVGASNGVSCHKIQYFINTSDDKKIQEVQIDVFNGTKWFTNINGGVGSWNQWTNLSLPTEMSVSKMQFRFYNKDIKSSCEAYVYEAQFLQSGTPQKCQLDLEVQWTDVSIIEADKWLCIYGGKMGSEDIRVDVWNGQWKPLLPDLMTGWNNISVAPYISSPNFTIRFSGSNPGGSVRDAWEIDAALLRSVSFGNSSMSGTIVIELLQNGTMRWLGQNLQLTTQAKPLPPIPVKSIHVNQTIANTSSEAPFQIEDWASEYRIPLGLTSNASIFNSRTMLAFLANSNVSKITIWWNGSDAATQTPYAYTNRYFTSDNVNNPDNALLTNGIVSLRIERAYDAAYGATVVKVTSTQGGSTAVARFMRVNAKNATFGDLVSYTIHHGVIRDIVTAEAEWANHGVPNCPNFYSHIVVTLPANATYYTYQLRLIFLDSPQNRTITDLCPLRLTVASGNPQTENGTLGGDPVASGATGLFYNQSPSTWAHHWSQFISGARGAGIMFTDDANKQLYFFDQPGKPTGAISVSNSNGNVIELRPVTINPVSFQNQADVTWNGAVATFDGTMPIYKVDGGVKTGLWMTVEYLPTVTVTTGN